MKEDFHSGLSEVFWNGEESRFRTPMRFVVSLLFLFVFALLVGGMAALLEGVAGDPGPLATTLAESTLVAVLLGGVLALVRFVDRRTFADVGLGLGRDWWREFGFGLVSGAVMVGAIVLALLSVGGTVSGASPTPTADIFTGLSVPVGLVVAAVFFLLVATLEELLFRGYVLVNVAEGLRVAVGPRRGVVGGVVVSTLLFGVAHAANPSATLLSTLNITLFGGLLGGAYVLTDRLAISVGMHVAWNFALGPIFGLPVSGLTSGVALAAVEPAGPALLTGGTFGPEGGGVSLLALLVGSVTVLWWLSRQQEAVTIQEQLAKPDLLSRM